MRWSPGPRRGREIVTLRRSTVCSCPPLGAEVVSPLPAPGSRASITLSWTFSAPETALTTGPAMADEPGPADRRRVLRVERGEPAISASSTVVLVSRSAPMLLPGREVHRAGEASALVSRTPIAFVAPSPSIDTFSAFAPAPRVSPRGWLPAGSLIRRLRTTAFQLENAQHRREPETRLPGKSLCVSTVSRPDALDRHIGASLKFPIQVPLPIRTRSGPRRASPCRRRCVERLLDAAAVAAPGKRRGAEVLRGGRAGDERWSRTSAAKPVERKLSMLCRVPSAGLARKVCDPAILGGKPNGVRVRRERGWRRAEDRPDRR
jgi:hypothetical protein